MIELAKVGRVDSVRVLLERHYTELCKSLETSTFVEPIFNHFPSLSLENEAALISLVTDCVVPKASELSELADFCIIRARSISDQDPRLAMDWLNVTLNPRTDSASLNSPLDTIRSLVHSAERYDIDSKISPLLSIVQTLVTLVQDFNIQYPRVSLAGLETDMTTSLTTLATDLITNIDSIELFESFVSKFDSIDRDAVILDRIKVLKNLLKESSRFDEESDVSPKRLRGDHSSINSLFDQIVFLLSRLHDFERLSEGIYETMIAVNANRFITAEQSDQYFASLSNLSPPSNSGYYSQLLGSYMAVQSVTASLIEFEDFQQVRDRPDFLMSQSNITMIVNKLCCEIGAVDKAISLGSVFPYIRQEDCWMLRLASLYFANEIRDKIDEIFNSSIEDPKTRSIVARDFASMILNHEHRSISDMEMINRIVVPFIEDEILLCRFFQIFFLQSEFQLVVNLNEIPSKFESLADFIDLMDNPNSIENRCKLERAKILFNLDSDLRELESKKRTLNLPVFRSANDVNEFLETQCDRFLRQSEIPDLSDVCQRVLIPSIKAAAVVNRCDEVMGAFGWSASFVDDAGSVLSNPENLDVHFDFEDDCGDAVLVLANTGERACNKISKLEFLVADIREAGIDVIDQGDGTMMDVAPIITSDNVSRNRRFAIMSEWLSLFVSLGLENQFDRDEFFRACENDKLAIKNILKIFLPKLIIKSNYDLKMCLDFLAVIGKTDSGALADLLITYMLTMLETESIVGMKLRRSVEELLRLGTSKEFVDRVMGFVVPRLVRDEAKLGQFISIVLEYQNDEEFEKIKIILEKIEKINSLVDNQLLRFERLVQDSEKILIDWLSGNAGCVEIVTETISLAKVLEVDKKIILKVLEKIVNFTQLTIMSGSVPISTVLILLENLGETEREIVGKELVSKLPLSAQQLEVVEYFANSSWVSLDDVLLLRNRLVLREYKLEELEDVLVQENGVKKVIERIFTDELLRKDLCVAVRLGEMNKVNWDKFKLDACRRWLNVHDDAIVDLVRCGGLSDQCEEKLVTMLLRVFFSPDEKPRVKVSCFTVLMRGFRLSVVKRVYGKRTDDLIDIEKNLMYMNLLVGRKIIKSDDIGYKEFHQLNKAQIAKGLIKNANKLDLLRIASWIMLDFGIQDFEITNSLKARLMSHGIQGMEILHAMSKQETEEVHLTDDLEKHTTTAIGGIRDDDSENLVLN